MIHHTHTKPEQFSDTLRRLFPDETHGSMIPGGNYVKDLTLQVTEDCNLRCTYCYQHNKTPKRMSFETGKKFIDLILASDERTERYIRSRECPGGIINFIGGEPFLEIDLISDLTDYTLEQMIQLKHPWLNRCIFGISTNGVLYFEPKVQDYLRRHAAHLSLTVTVDGNKKIHDACRIDTTGNGSYDRAIAAADHYYEHYYAAFDRRRYIGGTKITISPDNLPYIKDAIVEFCQNGRNDIFANCVYEEGWTIEHARVLYQQLKALADHMLNHDLQDNVFISILDDKIGEPRRSDARPWCGGSGLMLAVSPDGDIYPCLRYLPNSVGNKVEPYIIGHVDRGIITTPIEQERFNQLSCITRESQFTTTEHCNTCQISTGCGDCAAYSYEVFGKVGHRTTYICDMHKARVLAQIYYKNKSRIKTGIKDHLEINIPEDWALEIIDTNEFQMLQDIEHQACSVETK